MKGGHRTSRDIGLGTEADMLDSMPPALQELIDYEN
jgi:hypothetical protein